MKIYTKTGDEGETGLFGGQRVSKASDRVEAYGEVDELNSVLGVVRASGAFGPPLDALMQTIQSRLFDVGAELANPKGKALGIALVDDEDVLALEDVVGAAGRLPLDVHEHGPGAVPELQIAPPPLAQERR